MVNSFAEDFALAQKAIPYQNDIYKEVFPVTNIVRYEQDDNRILDIKYHIDVELELQNGIKLLGQEKALRFCFAKYNTFTMEFYQDRYKKEPGEFFNIGAQFYLHGYWNKNYNGFCKWYIIKLFEFLTHLKDMNISYLETNTRPSTSRASFYYINYNHIPIEFIYAQGGVISDSI